MGTRRVIMGEVVKRKFKYFGHFIGQGDLLERNNITGAVPGKRSKGGQRYNWFDNIKDWLGCTLEEPTRRAENRTRWRHNVVDARLGHRN